MEKFGKVKCMSPFSIMNEQPFPLRPWRGYSRGLAHVKISLELALCRPSLNLPVQYPCTATGVLSPI